MQLLKIFSDTKELIQRASEHSPEYGQLSIGHKALARLRFVDKHNTLSRKLLP